MSYIFKTERLQFRKMNQADGSALLDIFSDPVAMQYYPSTKNSDETLEWINWTQSNYRKFGVGLWVVEDKKTGAFLGQCGIVPQKVDGEVEMEIGYLFKRDVWGKGYATEAANACKDYGLYQLKLPQMISLIDPTNLASHRVAEKIGMKKSKVIHKWEKQLDLYVIKNEEASDHS